VAGDIRALIAGQADLAAYELSPPAIMVPIGPDGGSGQLAGSDDLASAERVAGAKGRDMMVDRIAQLFGVATPSAIS
jgi:apoptosis-inducing factor 2